MSQNQAKTSQKYHRQTVVSDTLTERSRREPFNFSKVPLTNARASLVPANWIPRQFVQLRMVVYRLIAQSPQVRILLPLPKIMRHGFLSVPFILTMTI